MVYQKRDGEEEQHQPCGLAARLQRKHISDGIGDEEADECHFRRDQETSSKDGEAHSREEIRVGVQRKSGHDAKSDPLPETDRHGEAERKEKEYRGEEKRQRQQCLPRDLA